MKKLFYAFIVIALGVGCRKDCPPHYTSKECDIEIRPAGVNLKRLAVTVTSTGWDDIGVAPDIYFVVTDESGSIELLRTNPQFNVTTGFWNGNIAFNPSDTCRILIFDYDDLDADDLIGSFTFELYQPLTGFPTDFIMLASGVKFSIAVEYVH